MRYTEVEQRAAERVRGRSRSRRGYLDTPCLIWMGGRSGSGYGYIRVGPRVRQVHVVAFLAAGGELPDGWHVHHRCERRLCVNPAHLEALDPAAHARIGRSPSAVRGRRKRCPRGHRYDVVSVDRNGIRHRSCRRCRNKARRSRYASLRAQGVSCADARRRA